MKRRVTVIERSRRLLTSDQDHVARKNDVHLRRGYARKVQEELHGRLGLDDVERRGAFDGGGAGVEQAPEVVRQLPAFDVDARHGAHLSTGVQKGAENGLFNI